MFHRRRNLLFAPSNTWDKRIAILIKSMRLIAGLCQDNTGISAHLATIRQRIPVHIRTKRARMPSYLLSVITMPVPYTTFARTSLTCGKDGRSSERSNNAT